MHELRHVFVMTYGRSGSTLLMGILNSIPGWLLRGENRHAMRHLYDFHRSGLAERARVDPARASQPTHPWFGIEAFPEAASLQHIRSLAEATLLRPEHDTRVTGYKEIRWYDEDLPDYVEFLRQVFPGARFVVNTRNLEDVAASNYWTHKDDPLAQVRRDRGQDPRHGGRAGRRRLPRPLRRLRRRPRGAARAVRLARRGLRPEPGRVRARDPALAPRQPP